MSRLLDILPTDPGHQATFHLILTIGWFLASIPICIFLAESVPFLVFISCYAVVASHAAAWQAARAEIRQKDAQ